MPGVSVVIITRNEAANIEAALVSAAWADERIVVDAGSADGTVEIARRMADRVEVRDWPGYGAQKDHAASIATHDWILSLDADERITPELAAEIRALLAAEPSAAGYRVGRLVWFLGRWIRSTDWYPDFQLRLYDRRRARWSDRLVHESVQVDGPTGTLRHVLHHFTYRDLAHQVDTIQRYTTLGAAQMARDGRRARAVDLALQPAAAFARNYVLRRGFTDGAAGFVVSLMNAYAVFLKFAKLWELERGPGWTRPAP